MREKIIGFLGLSLLCQTALAVPPIGMTPDQLSASIAAIEIEKLSPETRVFSVENSFSTEVAMDHEDRRVVIVAGDLSQMNFDKFVRTETALSGTGSTFFLLISDGKQTKHELELIDRIKASPTPTLIGRVMSEAAWTKNMKNERYVDGNTNYVLLVERGLATDVRLGTLAARAANSIEFKKPSNRLTSVVIQNGAEVGAGYYAATQSALYTATHGRDPHHVFKLYGEVPSGPRSAPGSVEGVVHFFRENPKLMAHMETHGTFDVEVYSNSQALEKQIAFSYDYEERLKHLPADAFVMLDIYSGLTLKENELYFEEQTARVAQSVQEQIKQGNGDMWRKIPAFEITLEYIMETKALISPRTLKAYEKLSSGRRYLGKTEMNLAESLVRMRGFRGR